MTPAVLERATSSPAAGLRSVEVLTALYKSGFTGEIVHAGTIRRGDPFYHAVHGGGRLMGVAK